MLKSSKPNSPSAPLPVNPKFHPNLGLRADPTHTHALLALDTAGVAALVSECPAAGVRGAPPAENAHRSERPRSSTPPILRQLPGRSLCASRSALRQPRRFCGQLTSAARDPRPASTPNGVPHAQ